ncbi:hypothetical protein BIV57_06255 [Mangrovactinospora gilvigrisea]|uniref:Oxygen sensor histidine kinase NreB n=2 Tax=Mangrovactinospora gilvigrisea TaxID=1428644 RepID=A0A1J7BIC7_9ACTN|nr:hypothetical protein BIV57_06255 [Mangrovactinospora gilvigrisea]
MHAAFFLLLAASASRYVARHGTGEADGPLVLGLTLGLAALYAVGVAAWEPLRHAGRAGRIVWLVAVIAAWVVLVLIAPAYAWCAIPLGFVCLEVLPVAAIPAAAGVLVAAVIAGQVRIADPVEPSLFLGPLAFAAMTVAVVLELRRRGAAEAEARHRAGAAAERERLSREIHDTLAQNLTSVQLLLTAADRAWPLPGDEGPARTHVRMAEATVGDGLAEARRFVRALAPPRDLESGSLPDALRRLAARVSAEAGLDARVQVDGEPRPLPSAVEGALLRTAQGALANVRDHAAARTAVLTLGYHPDRVTLDVRDDGVGFDGPPSAAAGPGRGHGLPGLRARLAEVDGELIVESASGEGTAVAAVVPL